MDSHSCPLSFSSCEYLLRFLGTQRYFGPFFFSSLPFAFFSAFAFLLRWCEGCVGSPSYIPHLHLLSCLQFCVAPPGPYVVFLLLPCTLLKSTICFWSLSQVCLLLFTFHFHYLGLGLCHLPLGLLHHLHVKIEHVKTKLSPPNPYLQNKCVASVFSSVSLKGTITHPSCPSQQHWCLPLPNLLYLINLYTLLVFPPKSLLIASISLHPGYYSFDSCLHSFCCAWITALTPLITGQLANMFCSHRNQSDLVEVLSRPGHFFILNHFLTLIDLKTTLKTLAELAPPTSSCTTHPL